MASAFYLKKGDTSPSIQATLTDGDGATIDLTGATVVFNMADEDGTLVVDGGSCNIDNNTDPAQVSYDWAADDTDTAGYFTAEFEVTYSDTSVETFPNKGFIGVHIHADLG